MIEVQPEHRDAEQHRRHHDRSPPFDRLTDQRTDRQPETAAADAGDQQGAECYAGGEAEAAQQDRQVAGEAVDHAGITNDPGDQQDDGALAILTAEQFTHRHMLVHRHGVAGVIGLRQHGKAAAPQAVRLQLRHDPFGVGVAAVRLQPARRFRHAPQRKRHQHDQRHRDEQVDEPLVMQRNPKNPRNIPEHPEHEHREDLGGQHHPSTFGWRHDFPHVDDVGRQHAAHADRGEAEEQQQQPEIIGQRGRPQRQRHGERGQQQRRPPARSVCEDADQILPDQDADAELNGEQDGERPGAEAVPRSPNERIQLGRNAVGRDDHAPKNLCDQRQPPLSPSQRQSIDTGGDTAGTLGVGVSSETIRLG